MNKLHFLFCVSKLVLSTLGFLFMDFNPQLISSTLFSCTDLPTNTLARELAKKLFIPLCVLVTLILLMCFAPVKKWRPSSFIPSPAPYFHTLYSDCQGDFKSWVITPKDTANVVEAEASLQIDSMIKCEDVPEEDCQPPFHHQLMEGSTYSNTFCPVSDASLLGIPYAASTMAPAFSPGSPTLRSQTGSPAEGDSGCWLCSETTSLETDSPWYCDKYCTLSTLTQTSPFTAEHRGSLSTKSCLRGKIRGEAIGEA
uniref:Uncharacterized protein n=1 Tax=Scophthalmus maximus TaxID=52904 RepID=A0A8D3CR22_SCOMX